MTAKIVFGVSLLMLVDAVWSGQNFFCMQECLGQGYDRGYCIGICRTENENGSGGMLNQPALPVNPAFEEVKPKTPHQRPMRIADPKCMKDCQRRGYSYGFCFEKVCSHTPFLSNGHR